MFTVYVRLAKFMFAEVTAELTIYMDGIIEPVITVDNSTQDSPSRETLIFNVGGTTFETYRSTLLRAPSSPVNNSGFLEEHFRPGQEDYFFDRDPDAFKIALNYLRTGHLYIPACSSSPSVRNELLFWGMTADEIGQTGNVGLTQVTDSGSEKDIGPGPNTRNATLVDSSRISVWNVLSEPATSLWAKLYAALSYVLICLAIFILVLQTTPPFQVSADRKDRSYVISGNATNLTKWPINKSHYTLVIIDLAILLFFTIEYILRFVFAPKRLTFVFSFLGVIDLLAIIPEFILLMTSFLIYSGTDELASLTLLQVLRIFIILRILRVFKHFKNLTKTEIITRTLKSSAGELVFVLSLFLVGTLVSATIAYVFESQNDYGGFRNIPEACYWAIVTMTTVGYGDLIPVTTLGQILSSFTAMYGLTMIGFMVAVLIKNLTICSDDEKGQNKELVCGGRKRK